MAKQQQNQKLDPHTFHVTPTCGDALPGFREGGIVVQILCALPQANASESLHHWHGGKNSSLSIVKTLRFGLDVSTADEKESIPYPQRPWVFKGDH